MARAIATESENDVIVARATAPGDGAIAIVRLSGAAVVDVMKEVFRPDKPGLAVNAIAPGVLTLGKLHRPVHENAVIDQAMLVLWRAPRSYTGEDVAELHLHGSHVVVSQAIEACIESGARIANPGEFTRRAYLNGKLDLAQAEAVCDLIRAQTEIAGRAALVQLGGGLSARLGGIRAALIPVVAELEAFVDFPEEGLEFQTRERLGRVVDDCTHRLGEMLDTTRRGRYVRDGARLVLAGPPNAGKSSLFNWLLRRERALVSPHAGTTRDTIEAQVDLAGIPLTIVDTAGLRATPEEVEALGIQRTHAELEGADLVVFLVDCQDAHAAEAEYERVRKLPHLVVASKIDLRPSGLLESEIQLFAGAGRRGVFQISAQSREGIGPLEKAIVEQLGGTGAAEQTGLVTNRRHAEAIRRAVESLQTVAQGLASELSPELLVVDLTEAVAALDLITGRQSLDEDVLDAIFSTFCLGK